jgi:uncharacterized protein (TIGR02246 family)
MDEAAFDAWLRDYGAAWEGRDAEDAAVLFADDATYVEQPFADELHGRDEIRDYWTAATGSQRDISFGHKVIAVVGDRGIARWWCSFIRDTTDEHVDLDGIFLITFGSDGGAT